MIPIWAAEPVRAPQHEFHPPAKPLGRPTFVQPRRKCRCTPPHYRLTSRPPWGRDDHMSDAATPGLRREFTLRALVLGCLLAVIFTAANTYLGLQVGLTFASAIPAAVISMTVLRALRNSTIWEN